MSKKYNKNIRHVIIDSNIIQHLANPLLADGILNCLKEAAHAGYPLAMSDYTFFELLNGITVEKEVQMMAELNNLVRLFVKKDILVASAHLGCLYQDDGIKPESVDEGDLIIGASAIITKSIIYTANVRDFPRPFFKTIEGREIDYIKKGVPAMLYTAFLEPDIDLIIKKHNHRLEPLQNKSQSEKTAQ